MKKLSALVLASLPLFILSCGFWNYEAPETFSVKTKNEYDFHLGTFNTRDHFSTEDILDSISLGDDAGKNKLKVYDYYDGTAENEEVMEYLKVIEEDKNFNSAKEKIEKNKPSVKQQAISQMDDCAAVNDFNTGISANI